MFLKTRVSTREQFYAMMANKPRGIALEQGRCSSAPDAIQAFATAEGALLTTVSGALTNLATGILALDATITQLENSPGTISQGDQALLTQALTQSQALVTQVQAISTTAPGATVPVTPPAAPAGS